MELDIDNILYYLLNTNILNHKIIVEEDLIILEVFGKNRNFKVYRTNGSSYMIKQEFENNESLGIKNEYYLYKFAMENRLHGKQLKKILPKLINFSSDSNILITELLPNSKSLYDCYYKLHLDLSSTIALSIAETMSLYHTFDYSLFNNDNTYFNKRTKPIPFYLAKPSPTIFRDINPANIELLKIIQDSPIILKSLESLWEEWKTKSLIHTDLHWDNILLYQSQSEHSSLKIADWESAFIGDPAWDIGTIFQEYIRYWIYHISIEYNEKEEKNFNLNLANKYQLIKNCLRVFWDSYNKFCKIPKEESVDLLLRSVRYCAAQLIHNVYEHPRSDLELSNNDICIIQTASNLFQNPCIAITNLFGNKRCY
jgi:thiamine kinase-like enzyme